MAHKDKNIFISHIHENDHKLRDLIGLLRRKGLQPRNYSITSDKPNNVRSERSIKRLLKRHIEPSPTLVVYITRDTRTSKWVNWEIETAAKMGKRIVGVWAHGDAGCPVPPALDRYHHTIVGWNGGNIVRAINGQLNNSYDSAGEPMIPRSNTPYRRSC